MKKVRKWGTIDDVIEAYFAGKDGPWYASNVYFKGAVLYSYGNHFPMAVRTPENKYVMNADKYSVTTSHHQSKCFGRVEYMLSFQILERMIEHEVYPDKETGFRGYVSIGDVANRITKGELEFLDSTPEVWETTGKWYWSKEGKNAKLITTAEMAAIKEKEQGQERKSSFWEQQERRPQTTLFKYKEHYYLASMDGRQYFTSQLPEPCTSIQKAFESLVPQEVLNMRTERQGEWFFVEVPGVTPKEAKKTYRIMERDYVLPKMDPASNDHTATRGGHLCDVVFMKNVLPVTWTGAIMIVSGNVRHSEHGRLTLSTLKDGPKLFAAFRNREVISWSASSVGIQID